MLIETVNELNDMLNGLVSTPNVNPVHYINFRERLGAPDELDTTSWADEIHPNREGFGSLAEHLVRAIESAGAEAANEKQACNDAAN